MIDYIFLLVLTMFILGMVFVHILVLCTLHRMNKTDQTLIYNVRQLIKATNRRKKDD